MTKQKLTEMAARKAGVPIRDAQELITHFLNGVARAVIRGYNVQLRPLGTMTAKKRASRKAYSFQKRKSITLPVRRVPQLDCTRAFKQQVMRRGK